jgi:hypothetical protein
VAEWVVPEYRPPKSPDVTKAVECSVIKVFYLTISMLLKTILKKFAG